MSTRRECSANCSRRSACGGPPLSFAPLLLLLGIIAGCTAAVSSVSPPSVTAGGPAFKMTVLGSGFTTAATVQWNGAARSTTYVSATELVAQINAADITSTGSASITVSNPGGTGASSAGSPAPSNARTITIVPPSIDATAWQIDPYHDGAVTFASVSFPASPAWRVSLGAGTPSNILIAGGNAFVATAAPGGSRLFALKQSSGAMAWGPKTFIGAVGTAAGLAYENGRVFVSGSGTVYAYDAATGALDWSTGLGAGLAGAPTAAGGLVYIVMTGNATLYALDESTGAITWQQPLSAARGSSAVTADGVYLTATTSRCHTIDFRPATGEVIWDSSEGTSVCPQTAESTPTVANQLVYSPNTSGTAIFSAETGASAGTLADSLPAAFNDTMAYFPQGANLDAIDLAGGTVAWTFTGDGTQLTAPPIIVNQYVITGSSGGSLYALDGASGKQLWLQTPGGQVRQVSAGDGLLLAVGETNNDGSGTLTAYTLSSAP